jgi:hypothetical protein
LNSGSWNYAGFIIRDPSCTGDILRGQPLVALLDISGSNFRAPSWRSLDSGIDYVQRDFPPGAPVVTLIDAFSWPKGIAPFESARFFAAILSSDLKTILTNIDSKTFGWR